jgi:hypothetical protein
VDADAPKTMAETRARMFHAVRAFRDRAAGTASAEHTRLAAAARRAIERLRKQFRHHIDDRLRGDATRRFGLSEGERLGLGRQPGLTTSAALAALDEAVRRLDSGEEGSHGV